MQFINPFHLFFCGPQGSQINQIPTKYSQTESTKFLILTVVSILCIVGVLLASTVVYCLRHRSHHKLKEKLTNLGTDTSSDATATYQVGVVTVPSVHTFTLYIYIYIKKMFCVYNT